MSDVLNIDFGQMPWSKSPASWHYHGATVWGAVKKTLNGEGERLVILCPASGNPHLEGLVKVVSTGARAEITVVGAEASPPVQARALIDMNEGRFTELLHGLKVRYAAPSDHVINIVVEIANQETDNHGSLLSKLWDLQLLAVKVLRVVFDISDNLPNVAKDTNLVQQLTTRE